MQLLLPGRTCTVAAFPRRWARASSLLVLAIGLSVSSPGHAASPAAPVATPTSQPTEQRWIVASVVKDCVNLAAFAADPEHWSDLPAGSVELRDGPGAAVGDSYVVTVSLPGNGDPVVGELKITETPWSPELYVPILRAIQARLKIAPPAKGDQNGAMTDAELLKALSNLLTAEMETRNQRLSAWLQVHPLDAQAHQQAALLLGTLAMRENCGWLWNPLGLCNRAAAHLAFARALQPEPSECGGVAELLIGLIIDTKADCQRRITALQAQATAHPELAPWAMAAALRNTRDYRLLTNPESATLLERIELLRALSESTYAAAAIKRVRNLEPATAPDWTRIILQGDYGVDSGHRYAGPSVGLEFNDLRQVFPALRKTADPDQFAAVLNLPSGDAVQFDADHHARLRVIDPGAWAQFFQRHLFHAADETYYFLGHKWGVPEEAEKFRAQAAPMLKRLTLYPLCLSTFAKSDGDAVYAQVADLAAHHPEWVSNYAWKTVVKLVPDAYAPDGSWAAVSRRWFSPRLPTGTVYGFDWRTNAGGVLPSVASAEWERYYRIAPLKFSVCSKYADATAPAGRATVEQYQRAVGALLAYYVPAIKEEATLVEGDPLQYGKAMSRAAAVNPNYYLTLGKYDADHRLDLQAAEAYQAAIDRGADTVSVSSKSGWLVNYYYEHGQPERAMAIAQEAAEVYSAGGLATMAELLERMGRLKEAESYYEKIKERYNNGKPLMQFHLRTVSTRPMDPAEMKSMEAKIFPQGIPTVTLAELTGKPARGVLVRDGTELTRSVVLKPGAIVVGLDGKRVANSDQYAYVRALSASPEMDFLIYQDDRYQAIHVSAPKRMLGVRIADWPEQK